MLHYQAIFNTETENENHQNCQIEKQVHLILQNSAQTKVEKSIILNLAILESTPRIKGHLKFATAITLK